MLELSDLMFRLKIAYFQVQSEGLIEEWKHMSLEYVLRNLHRIQHIRCGEELPEAD